MAITTAYLLTLPIFSCPPLPGGVRSLRVHILIPALNLLPLWQVWPSCLWGLSVWNRDFPDGAVVKNLPASAGDTGSIPGPGRSHMPWSNWARVPQLLSLHATTTEARVPRARARQQREATAMRNPCPARKSSPHSPQLERTRTAMKTQRSQK